MLLIFDLNHVAYRCLFAARKDIADVGWQYFKHVMYNHIFSLCKKFDATKVVLAVDSKENWRKKIYPEYKQHRKENREKEANDDINWDEFFKAFQEFVDDTKKNFPFYVLNIKYMEADDIAAILSKNLQQEDKIIITSDSDYVQLLKYNNIKIYDPMKMSFVKCDDPDKKLQIKILMGDKGDNVPAIKPKIGIKTAEKIANSPELLNEMLLDSTPSYTKENGDVVTIGDEISLKLKRNTALIDLNKIPEIFCTKLLEVYTKYELPTGKDIATYFISNKYRDLTRRLEEIDQIIKRIKTAQTKDEEFSEVFG